MSRIFHVATAADWEAARSSGSYTTSTYGVTLEEEGFLHASHAHQWEDVLARYHADCAEPLVLLEIETDLLGVDVVEEAVSGTGEAYPHVYGALDPAAVVGVRPVTAPSRRAGS
ncbi:DUF952 domain-containing protein [Nocardioides sp. GXQ0305]|uniref:DUF952 domain-containing protein n=1 Tax=Nocardioides sp. GXQ0305 TaxID=3423912 RepID=UPI003D7E5C88